MITPEPVPFPHWAIKSGIDTPLYRHVGDGPISDDYWASATDYIGTIYAYHPDKAVDGLARGVVPGEWELVIDRQGA